jgi:hypothetical protein
VTQRGEHQSNWEIEDGKERAANEQEAIRLSGINALLTGLLLVTAIAQVILFFWQLRLIRESAGDAQKAATAAHKSADAAQTQAQSLMTAQRAWLSFINVEARPFENARGPGVDGASGYRFQIQLRNAGNTPALSANLYSDGRLVPANAEVPAFGETPKNDVESRRGVLAQGVHFSSAPYLLLARDLAALQNRQVRLFLFARIEYEDIFQSGQLRVTEVCVEAKFAGFVTVNGVQQLDFYFQPSGPQNLAI